MVAQVTMYSTQVSPYCIRAKALLARKGITEINEIRVDLQPELREEMLARSNGLRTVPQIFINDLHVGGCDDLHALDHEGKLDPLLDLDN